MLAVIESDLSAFKLRLAFVGTCLSVLEKYPDLFINYSFRVIQKAVFPALVVLPVYALFPNQ